MNAKLKMAARKPVDDWEEFRPAGLSRRQPSRSLTPKLLLLSFISAVFFFAWVFFRPPIRGTVAEIRKAISELGQRNTVASRSRVPTPAVVRKAVPPLSGRGRAQPLEDSTQGPGPFEVYLLDGDRYVRVDAKNKSVLLNVETGETTWMDSDSAGENSR